MGSWVLPQTQMAEMKWTQWRWAKSRRLSNGEAGELFGSSMWSENPSQGWQDIWGGEKEGVPSLQWMKYQQEKRCMASLKELQNIRGFCLRTVEEQWPGNLIGCQVSLEEVCLGPVHHASEGIPIQVGSTHDMLNVFLNLVMKIKAVC